MTDNSTPNRMPSYHFGPTLNRVAITNSPMSHRISPNWWLLGKPKPVSVMGVTESKFGPRGEGYWHFCPQEKDFYTQYAADDYAGGFIRFENGVGLQVESFWASHQPNELQIGLFGTEAGAQLRPIKLYKTVNNAPQDIAVELPKSP